MKGGQMADAVCPLLSLVYVLIQCRFYIPVVAVRGRLWWIFAKKSRVRGVSRLQFWEYGV